MDKFNEGQLQFMYEYATDLIDKFGYTDLFIKNTNKLNFGIGNYIEDANERNLKFSMHVQFDADEVTSILANYPALLIRKKTEIYPDGRTSYRFKRFLRKKVTILAKSDSTFDAQNKKEKEEKETREKLKFNEQLLRDYVGNKTDKDYIELYNEI